MKLALIIVGSMICGGAMAIVVLWVLVMRHFSKIQW